MSEELYLFDVLNILMRIRRNTDRKKQQVPLPVVPRKRRVMIQYTQNRTRAKKVQKGWKTSKGRWMKTLPATWNKAIVRATRLRMNSIIRNRITCGGRVEGKVSVSDGSRENQNWTMVGIFAVTPSLENLRVSLWVPIILYQSVSLLQHLSFSIAYWKCPLKLNKRISQFIIES